MILAWYIYYSSPLKCSYYTLLIHQSQEKGNCSEKYKNGEIIIPVFRLNNP